MVRNVPWRGKDSNPRNRQTPRWLPNSNTLCRNRYDVSPQAIMRLAERPPGAGDEALGIGHMRRAIGVNMHLEVREAGNEVAGPTRMIEVYVREQDVPDVGESDAQFGQAVLEAVERRGGARVYDCRLGTIDPIG